MTRLELVQQIKFALARLGDSNRHHDFENICLEFARQRISANFLPATGPVSGRGDQGRDAETFWSNLAHEADRETSAGRARVGDETVVLACTLQARSLSAKLASDLAAITERGTSVDRVLYFVNSPVPVGDRHMWIATARTDFEVELEVFDLEALSVHLADPDLFWVASEYLRIPTDAAPAVPAESGLPDWYLEIRERWRQAGRGPSTFGDLAEARFLARAATWNDDARPDLEFALELLGQLAVNESAEIRWQAAYEICVATYRGTDDFRSIEARLLELVDTAIAEQLDPVYLHDAAVLLTYGVGAAIRGRSTTGMVEWRGLMDNLSEHVARELGRSGTANYKVSLLSVDVHLAFAIDYPADVVEQLAAVAPGAIAYGEELPVGEALPEVLPLVDLDRGMRSLQELLEALPQAPMFPLGRIAVMFDLLTLSLVEHPLYASIRDGIDAGLAQANGAAEAAERALYRALMLADRGKFRLALSDAIAASLAYWRAHDVAGSAKSMIVEGDLLRVMGLHLAAKARYLAAAWAAGAHTDDSVKAIAAEALIGAAMQDYYLGRWLTALPELLDGFEHHAHFLHNPADVETHEYLVPANQALTNILAVARSFPSLQHWICEALGGEAAALWDAVPAATTEMLQELNSEVTATLPPPFSDLQDRLSVRWISFGTRWEVDFPNDPSLIRAAERLTSALQLMLVSLGDSPLEWIPTTVQVSVIAGVESAADFAEEARPGGGVAITVSAALDESAVDMDPASRLAALGNDAKKAALAILATAFVSGEDGARAVSEQVQGPRSAFSSPAVRLYDDTARVIEPRWPSAPTETIHEGLPFEAEIPFTQTSLVSPEGPSPLFDEAATRQRIRERYDAAIPNLWRTLPRIVSDASCMAVITSLRTEGALDWQLLSGIFNLVGTQRVANAGLDPEDETAQAEIEAVMRSPETDDEMDIPLDLFTREDLERSLVLVAFTALPSYGLQSHSRFPDVEAIRALLAARFEYSHLDVNHANVFGWPEVD